MKQREKVETAFQTSFGAAIQPVYSVEDVRGPDPSWPGEFPFTRGLHPTMYRSRLWTMRQYAGFGTAAETNRRFRYLLAQGQTGLSVAFDLPTQMGYDSDHPLAAGEVGRAGVAIDTLADLEALLEGIPLDRVSLSMTINAPAAILLCMVAAVAEKQGVAWEDLRGTIQNDILKEYVARHTYIFPPQPALRLVVDTAEFCTRQLPQWNWLSVSGYHLREAGANAVQEIAFTLGNALTYLEAARKRGLDVDAVAPRLSFFFSASHELLEEVAKFRAARRLWAHLTRDRLGARDARSWHLRFHAQTAGSSLTAQQPENNIVRTTLEALAAVLGGAQSLHTNAYDEALALPTEQSARLALRTQQIIAYETGVPATADPLGGSYCIESLTEQIEAGARGYLERIEQMGGMLVALEKGFLHREIQDSAYRIQQDLESGRLVKVGVNRFGEEENVSVPLLAREAFGEATQQDRLRQIRSQRDPLAVARALAALEEGACRDGINLVPLILAAVRAYASVGEIRTSLERHFGTYREAVQL